MWNGLNQKSCLLLKMTLYYNEVVQRRMESCMDNVQNPMTTIAKDSIISFDRWVGLSQSAYQQWNDL